MSTVIDSLERAQLRRVPTFDAGDRLRVHFQVIEGTRRRTQVFEGVVIKRQGHGARETFTVRKQSFGVGVERTFPLHSPKIERIEVAARGDVRRAKLYYLRGRVGKRARVRERRSAAPEVAVERELLHAPVPEEPEEAVEETQAEAARRRPGRAGGGDTGRGRRRGVQRCGVRGVGPPDGAAGRQSGRHGGTRRRTEGVTKASKSPLSTLIELAVVVVTALALALAIQAFLVKPYRIPSGSMLPTVRVNQRVLVDRIGMDFSSIHVGDIIVFHPPKNYAAGCANPSQGESPGGQDAPTACEVPWRQPSSQTFIKRVVGLPGDRLSIRDGHVFRNGKRESDSYIIQCDGDSACNFPQTITVPRGYYYMMGDNRPDSEDSRFWGPVPRAWIIGKAFLTYWPPDRIGFL